MAKWSIMLADHKNASACSNPTRVDPTVRLVAKGLWFSLGILVSSTISELVTYLEMIES